MKRISIVLMMFSVFISSNAQRLNEYGQKVVKEIFVGRVNKQGEEEPQEKYRFEYDDANRLTGILREIYEDGNPDNEPMWYVSDSIYVSAGRLNRTSYYFDRGKYIRYPDGYSYTYTLDSYRNIVKVIRMTESSEYDSRSKYIYTFSYEPVPGSNKRRWIKHEWEEWWKPSDEKRWYKQGGTSVRLRDYRSGVWAERAIDKTIEEAISSMQKYVDYNMPDDLNIDLSGILNHHFYSHPDFKCESITEWMPRRLGFFPLNIIGLHKYRPYEYKIDENGNIIEAIGFWENSGTKNLRPNSVVRIVYL